MPLESLSNEQINIHDIALEEENKPKSESLKLLEDLKNSDLYDQELGQWNKSIERGCLNDERYTDTQLVGILAEALFNRSEAENLYNSLKKTPLFDKTTGEWHDSMNSDQQLEGDMWDKFNWFLSMLIEEKFDHTKTFEKYSEYNTHPKDGMIDYYSFSKLLEILLESKLGICSPSDELEKMKINRLLDTKQDYFREDTSTSDIYDICSKDQLLGVLVLAQFDRVKAQSKYLSLKKSPLYDPESKKWHYKYIMSENKIVNSIITEDQLLGILCEHEFEEPTSDIQSSTPSIPETRKY